jgi:hypothetical protein
MIVSPIGRLLRKRHAQNIITLYYVVEFTLSWVHAARIRTLPLWAVF